MIKNVILLVVISIIILLFSETEFIKQITISLKDKNNLLNNEEYENYKKGNNDMLPNIPEINEDKNIILFKKDILKNAVFTNTVLDDDMCIILSDDVTEGVYHSPVINTIKYKEIIASWNSDTNENTTIELMVKIRKDDKWSKWFTYGEWSDKGNNLGSIGGQVDKIALMDTDVIKTQMSKASNAFRYKIILRRNNSAQETPKIRMTAFTLRPREKFADQIYPSSEIDIDVPVHSQMIVPDIGNSICSPTTLSMLMEYNGYVENPGDVASHVIDNSNNIYGNWSYNMAYASERGFESYIQICNSIEDVKKYIMEDIPIGISVETQNQEELGGSPMAYPSGHLMLIRGFTNNNGEDYIIVNDPAAPDDNSVTRKYKLIELVNAWNNVIYVIKKY